MDLDVFAGWAMALLFLAAVVSAWLGVCWLAVKLWRNLTR